MLNKNKLHLIINEEIKNVIKESNINEILDLNDSDSVINWLKKYGPESIFDDDGNINWEYTDTMTGDDLETLILLYKEKYNEIRNKSSIKIYRMLKLNTINDLDLNNVGVFWSFDENGVGAYGVGHNYTGENTFILTAIVNTKDIDWEQGFYSFLLYGRSEFECYMKKGSICIITHINDEKLDKPIYGKC